MWVHLGSRQRASPVLCGSVRAKVSAEAPQCSVSRRDYVAVVTHYLVGEVTNAGQKEIVQ